MQQECGDELHHIHACEDRLDAVPLRRSTTRQRQRGLDAAVQDSNPAQGKKELGTGGQFHPRRDTHRADVDVGLIEPVEEHQSVGAGAIDGAA